MPFLAMLGSRAFCELWTHIAKGRSKGTKHLFTLLWCFITYFVVPLVCWDPPFVFVHLHLYLWLTSSSSLIIPISSTQNKFTVAWYKSCLHGSLAKSLQTQLSVVGFFFSFFFGGGGMKEKIKCNTVHLLLLLQLFLNHFWNKLLYFPFT